MRRIGEHSSLLEDYTHTLVSQILQSCWLAPSGHEDTDTSLMEELKEIADAFEKFGFRARQEIRMNTNMPANVSSMCTQADWWLDQSLLYLAADEKALASSRAQGS